MARGTHIDQNLLDLMNDVNAEATPQAATARALPATKYIVDNRSSTSATKATLVIVSLIGLYLAYCAYQNFVRTGNICPTCTTVVSAPASTPASTPAAAPSTPRTVGNSAYCVKPDGSATQWLAHGTGTAIGNNGLRYTRCAAQAAPIQVATAGVTSAPSAPRPQQASAPVAPFLANHCYIPNRGVYALNRAGYARTWGSWKSIASIATVSYNGSTVRVHNCAEQQRIVVTGGGGGGGQTAVPPTPAGGDRPEIHGGTPANPQPEPSPQPNPGGGDRDEGHGVAPAG